MALITSIHDIIVLCDRLSASTTTRSSWTEPAPFRGTTAWPSKSRSERVTDAREDIDVIHPQMKKKQP